MDKSPPKMATTEYIPDTSIQIFRTVAALRDWRRKQLLIGKTIGLVPTMGALHEGHCALIQRATESSDDVVVSIYVNPTQFGVHEDLSSYPTTWEADCAALRELERVNIVNSANNGKIAAVFAPSTSEMYPSGPPAQEIEAKGSYVTITPVGELLEGASRPTFFRGVATVCMKLFNIVCPETTYFGQKDVQQTVVIKKMVKDFCLNINVVVVATKREQDGLALSSRNVYLGPRRRKVAPILYKVLQAAAQSYAEGNRSRHDILGASHTLAEQALKDQHDMEPEDRALFAIDYVSMADPDTMQEVDFIDVKKGAIISAALKMLPVESPTEKEDLGLAGGPVVRLIDNIVIPGTSPNS